MKLNKKKLILSAIVISALLQISGCNDSSTPTSGANTLSISIAQTKLSFETLTVTNTSTNSISSFNTPVITGVSTLSEVTPLSTCESTTFPIVPGGSCTYAFYSSNGSTPGVSSTGSIKITSNFSAGDPVNATLSASITTYLYAGTSTGVSQWNGTDWSVISGSPTNVQALAFGGSGDLFSGSSGSNAVKEWNGTSWAVVGTSTPSNVRTLIFDFSGNLIEGGSESGTPSIQKWDGSSWTTVGSSLPIAGVVAALAVAPSGNLYAGIDSKVYESDSGTGAWTALGAGPFLINVGAIVVDYSGNLYAGINLMVDGVYEYSPAISPSPTGTWTLVGTGGTGPGAVTSLVADSSNNIYSGSSAAANSVKEWNGSSWATLGTPPSTTNALAIDSDNNIFAGTTTSAKWNGSMWTTLGTPPTGGITAYAIGNQLTISQ